MFSIFWLSGCTFLNHIPTIPPLPMAVMCSASLEAGLRGAHWNQLEQSTWGSNTGPGPGSGPGHTLASALAPS